MIKRGLGVVAIVTIIIVVVVVVGLLGDRIDLSPQFIDREKAIPKGQIEGVNYIDPTKSTCHFNSDADINKDCEINFLDLSFIQDEWGTLGQNADLNNDNFVDNRDLAILIDQWDGIEGDGECDEFSIPNTIGSCTEILCGGEGALGANTDSTYSLQFNSLGEEYAAEIKGSGYFLTIFNSYTNEISIHDIGLETEKIVGFDEVLYNGELNNNKITLIEMSEISLEKEYNLLSNNKNHEIELLAGGEIINVTYNKTSDLGGGLDSWILVNLVCYSMDERGKPYLWDILGQETWNQNPGEIKSELLVTGSGREEWDDCQVRLHELNFEALNNGEIIKLSLVSDVAESVFFSDENLHKEETFESLKQQVSSDEDVYGVNLNDDFGLSATDGICPGFEKFELYINEHPDFQDIASYGITSKKVNNLQVAYANKERYLTQGWAGYPLENERIDEKKSLIHNPALINTPKETSAIFLASNTVIFDVGDGDLASTLSYFSEPFVRKMTVHTYNNLIYSDFDLRDFKLSTWSRTSYLNNPLNMNVILEGKLNFIPEESTLLNFFEDLVRLPLITNQIFVGWLHDESENINIFAYPEYDGGVIFDFGEIYTTSPSNEFIEGTGLNVLNCINPDRSNPPLENCEDGLYKLDYDYTSLIDGEIEGEDCILNNNGFLTIDEC